MTIIDCTSDLHGFYPKLEGGDLLIVAGDLTARDKLSEYQEFLGWISRLDYKKKIVVAGNHDNVLDDGSTPRIFEKVDAFEYLCDSGTTFEGLKIWGSPWTKTFFGINPHCKAFTFDTEKELAEKFSLIPEDTDILITHGPPFGILDKITTGENVGSVSLKENIEKIMPEMVIFGHIHENGGQHVEKKGILYINGSIVDERYRLSNGRRRVFFKEKMQQVPKSDRVSRFFCKK